MIDFSHPGRRERFCGGLIAAATVLVFGRIVGNGFLVDWDDQMIYANVHLQALTWQNVQWMFSDVDYHPRHIYMPLAWLWWTLVNQTLGLSPQVYHGLSLLFHAMNGVLVFMLIRRVCLRVSPGDGPAAAQRLLLIPAFAALVWALHPLRVEPVAWAITQKFLIGTTLLIGAIFCWLRWLEGRVASAPAVRWYFLALASFAASLLFYPMAVAAPGVFGLLALAWPDPAQEAQSWFRRVIGMAGSVTPFLMLGVLVMLPALGLTHGMVGGGELSATGAASWWPQLMEAAYIWLYFLWKPLTLGPFSPVYTTLIGFDPNALPFVGSLAGLAAVSLLALALWRRYPWILVLWLCHLGLLIPVLGLGRATANFPNDRYAYQAGICWSVLLALVLLRLPWGRWPAAARRTCFGLGVCWLAMLGRTSYTQTAHWHDTATFFEYTLQQLKGDDFGWIIQVRLGYYHEQAGRLVEARTLLAAATQNPTVNYDTLLVLGDKLEKLGDSAAAAAATARAAAIRPGFNVFMLLARQTKAAGHTEASLDATHHALKQLAGEARRGANAYVAHYNLGHTYYALGRLPEAALHYRQAAEIRPEATEAHYNLGNTLLRLSRVPEAIGAYQRALRLNRNYADAHFNLAQAYLRVGRPIEAVEHAEALVRLESGSPEAHDLLRRARQAMAASKPAN